MSALCVKLERNSLYVPPPPQLSTCSMWTTRGKIIIYISILPSTHILPVVPSTPYSNTRTPNVKTVKCKNKKYTIFQEYSTFVYPVAFCNITVT